LKFFELVSNGLSIDFKCAVRWTDVEVQTKGSTHGGCHYVKETIPRNSSPNLVQVFTITFWRSFLLHEPIVVGCK
jgi:hypothetical protein